VLLVSPSASDESTIAASAVPRIGARAGHRHEPHRAGLVPGGTRPAAGIQPHG